MPEAIGFWKITVKTRKFLLGEAADGGLGIDRRSCVNQTARLRVLSCVMKKAQALIASVVLGLCLIPRVWAEDPVVIELFTSEGCSSCPPADALLVQLSQKAPPGVDLILLGEHVDYWNHDGWSDRFSSAEFSRRQSDYEEHLHVNGPYTPQMVVDGHLQLVGNDASALKHNLQVASAQPKIARVSLQWEASDHLKIGVQAPAPTRARVFVAITEDGLTTAIGGGENSGRTLHHAAVVRELRELGSVKNGSFEKIVEIARHSDWNAANLKIAVLVQDADGGPILGAASLHYKP
jgi:hypothetical protein